MTSPFIELMDGFSCRVILPKLNRISSNWNSEARGSLSAPRLHLSVRLPACTGLVLRLCISPGSFFIATGRQLKSPEHTLAARQRAAGAMKASFETSGPRLHGEKPRRSGFHSQRHKTRTPPPPHTHTHTHSSHGSGLTLRV